mgnify:CR=1 FL=1
MKISKRDVSLLISFVGILIGFLAYQFGYVQINEKVEAIETQNTQMRTEISQLEALQANQAFYEEETTRMDGEITEKVNEFACDVLPEDEMKFAYQQDSTATIGTRLFVTSMSFADPELLYTTNQQTTQADTAADGTTADGTTADATTVTSADGSVQLSDVIVAGELYPTMYLYQTQTNYGVECSYTGIKNMVKAILNDNRRRGIDTISLAYDDSTGQLNGSAIVDSYFLLGTDKTYAQPSLTPVQQGTDDIFGTVNTPNVPESGTTTEAQ